MSLVFELMTYFEKNQTLHAACDLKLFDILAEAGGDVDVESLGKRVGCQGSTDLLERFCNLCCSLGLLEKFSNDGKASYSNSSEAQELLVSSSPSSQLAVILEQKSFSFTALRHDSIVQSVVAGRAKPLQQMEGEEEKNIFTEVWKKNDFYAFGGMMDAIGMTLNDDLKTMDLGKYKHAVDLGGCLGAVARCMKKNYPDMTVTLGDLKAPIEFAKEFPANKDVDLQYEAVDFFKGGLPSADLYILGHILHDWNNERSLEILANVKRALHSGGAVLILDVFLNDDKTGPSKATVLDLHMLTCMSGRERTGGEFTNLLQKAGFGGIKLLPLENNFWYDAVLGYVA